MVHSFPLSCFELSRLHIHSHLFFFSVSRLISSPLLFTVLFIIFSPVFPRFLCVLCILYRSHSFVAVLPVLCSCVACFAFRHFMFSIRLHCVRSAWEGDANIDIPIHQRVASVGRPITDGQRFGGDRVSEFDSWCFGTSSAQATGRHVPDLRAPPIIWMRQYIEDGDYGSAVVPMLDVRRFEAMPVDGQKPETVDQTRQQRLTRVGGWLSRWADCGGRRMLGVRRSCKMCICHTCDVMRNMHTSHA